MITLGIETSCDETAAALLANGRILANAVYSQVEHGRFGGVVPEIASRAHLEKVDRLAAAVMKEAEVAIQDIGLVAVTDSPGLAGALLVGVSFALGLHVRHGMPVTGVNHLEGHICAILLSNPAIELPFLALVVSGGHTAIYRVDGVGSYACLGRTVDDAAGEAFDKVGKMLGFTYPAGRAIEEEARKAKPEKDGVPAFPVARLSGTPLDFSFSGLKTAVKYFVAEKGAAWTQAHRPLVCRSFQEAVVNSLVNNCAAAAQETGINRIALVGGVACNTRLREALRQRLGGQVFVPPPELCVDNGAMIACAGYKRFKLGLTRFPHMDPNGAI
ncbi:MAG: tRNA (adenosine(37)-N6)-threonylcarbamoyltransferase complex transferase subunit TsaD [Chitinispirillaceae bacterium]|nr:tRNA (adenosine(37)-N6)-threonylcarbamoyltransferase complex transferase subunit TsaD [Chitinispirillaceae bacterium]